MGHAFIRGCHWHTGLTPCNSPIDIDRSAHAHMHDHRQWLELHLFSSSAPLPHHAASKHLLTHVCYDFDLLSQKARHRGPRRHKHCMSKKSAKAMTCQTLQYSMCKGSVGQLQSAILRLSRQPIQQLWLGVAHNDARIAACTSHCIGIKPRPYHGSVRHVYTCRQG